MPERAVLTDALVSRLGPAPSGERRVWDTRVKGFCARVHPSGRVVFCLKRQEAGGSRWLTIGAAGSPWSTAAARARALELKNHGGEPREIDWSTSRKVGMLRVESLVEIYLREARRERLDKRETSWVIEEKSMQRHLLPALGKMRVVDVERRHIVALIAHTAEGKAPPGVTWKEKRFRRWGGPGAARILWANTNTMFNWAVGRGLAANNPAAKIRLPKRPFVGKRLSLAQVQDAFSAIDELIKAGRMKPMMADVLKLLMYTGARKAEICFLAWPEVSWDERAIILTPARTKTGNRTGGRRVPLSEPAFAILKDMPMKSNQVFPCFRPGGTLAAVNYNWKRVLQQANLPRVRVHDIRHTFASIAADNGESLLNISAALGHTNLATTQVYLHHHHSAVAAMSDRFGQLLQQPVIR